MQGPGDGGQQHRIQHTCHRRCPEGNENPVADGQHQADGQAGQGKGDDNALGIEGARFPQRKGADELQRGDQRIHGAHPGEDGLMVTGMPATVHTTRSQAAAMA